MKTVKNKPIIYGLTGGIASGKSIASDFFVNKDIKVFDSDEYVKSLWNENQELVSTVNNKYQLNIQTKEGKAKLANIIFNDELEKAYINSLVHPLVFKGIEKWLIENQNEKFVIIDMPLLFETGYETKVDKTIVIYTTKMSQVKRLMKRDNLSLKAAKLRINAQLDLKIKAKMGSYVIRNTKSLKYLYDQLELLYGGISDESRF